MTKIKDKICVCHKYKIEALSGIIIDKPHKKERLKCFVKDCNGEVKRSAYMQIDDHKNLVFFCEKHREKFIDRIYFRRHGLS